MPKYISNISHNFQIWLVDFINGRIIKIDMNCLGTTFSDKVSRFFDGIIPHRENEIGFLNRSVDIVFVGECCGSDVLREIFSDDSFPHLRVEKRDIVLFYPCSQVLGNRLSICSCSNEYDRSFCFGDFLF